MKSETTAFNGNIKRRMKKYNLKASDCVFLVSMLILPIIYFAVFWVYVHIDSTMLAFKTPTGEYSTLTLELAWKTIVESGSTMQIAMRNTAIFFALNILNIPFGVLVAYFFYRRLKGFRVFQIIFYLPQIISTVVITQTFADVISVDGPLGLLCEYVGINLPKQGLLGNADTAIWTVVFYYIWVSWGGNMLLLGGAMARLPVEVLESARIDGVNTFQEIVNMVFPLLWSSISTFLVLAMTGLLTASGPILALTAGAHETTTISYWIYEKLRGNAVSQSNYNEVAAVGLILTVIYVPIILLCRWAIEKIPVVEY